CVQVAAPDAQLAVGEPDSAWCLAGLAPAVEGPGRHVAERGEHLGHGQQLVTLARHQAARPVAERFRVASWPLALARARVSASARRPACAAWASVCAWWHSATCLVRYLVR